MISKKHIPPTATFPYKIRTRLNTLSQPRKYINLEDGMPKLSKISGTRKSALIGCISDRNSDIAWPFVRDIRRKKGWSDSDAKKLKECILQKAGSKKILPPPPIKVAPGVLKYTNTDKMKKLAVARAIYEHDLT